MSGKKERFVPLMPPKVNMFVCGPTVQSLMHLGHARSYVFYDVIARYLAHLGYRVKFVMNVTDLDERITDVAREMGEDPVRLARRYTDAFIEDLGSLNCSSVSELVPVSEHIDETIRQVGALIDSGHAYVAGKWVYFDTSRFRRFGRLSHMTKEDLSLRPMELSPQKRHLNDFALWRPEVLVKGKWTSPWGLGSPGWHVQDTAVTLPAFGPQYDIHGGAYELIYPHHEAEIALAESLTGRTPLVKYWVHTRHMNMEGRKMSKSAGNVLTVRDALVEYSPSEIRLFLLSTHYRKDMDLSGMKAASGRMKKLRRLAVDMTRSVVGSAKAKRPSIEGFKAAMSDDFDTPRAISWIEGTLERGVREKDGVKKREALAAAAEGARILGVELFEGNPPA
jgi:cysteinyl-tRNA synthetase